MQPPAQAPGQPQTIEQQAGLGRNAAIKRSRQLRRPGFRRGLKHRQHVGTALDQLHRRLQAERAIAGDDDAVAGVTR